VRGGATSITRGRLSACILETFSFRYEKTKLKMVIDAYRERWWARLLRSGKIRMENLTDRRVSGTLVGASSSLMENTYGKLDLRATYLICVSMLCHRRLIRACLGPVRLSLVLAKVPWVQRPRGE